MTTTYFPFASGAGANVSESGWGAMARHWLGTGILHGELNDSLVYGDSSGMQVKVKSGRAWLDGFFFQDDASGGDTALSIAAADPSNPRVDLVVLRLDHTIPSIAYVVLTGTPAGSPVAPTPTQTVGGRWELPLAKVAVAAAASTISAANVTDQRTFAAVGWAKTTPTVNLLANGGMEVKQRTPATFTSTGILTLDQWVMQFSGAAALTVSQIASTIGARGFSGQLAYTHAASQFGDLFQKIENYKELQGRVVTFAVTVKSTVNGTVKLYLYDGANSFSAYNVGTGSQRLSLTAVIGAGATLVLAGIRCDVATCTVEVNDAMLVTGAQPVDYVPLSPADDLARCQRYYEKLAVDGDGSLFIGGGDNVSQPGPFAATFPYKVAKAVASPTVTVVGTWTLGTNVNTPTVAVAGQYGCKLALTLSANSTTPRASNGGSGANVTVEANP